MVKQFSKGKRYQLLVTQEKNGITNTFPHYRKFLGRKILTCLAVPKKGETPANGGNATFKGDNGFFYYNEARFVEVD